MALKTYRERDPRVMFEDTFEDSTSGWQQLMGGGYSAPYADNAAGGAVGLVSWPSLDGGNSLEFHSEDTAPSTPSADPMVLKRLVREQPDENGRYVVRWDVAFAYKVLHSAGITPRAIDFGFDTATSDGHRRFGKFRLFTNDGTNKWQMASGASPGTYTDIPGTAGLVVGINENKAGWNVVSFYVDLANHKYLGLVINGNEFGQVPSPLPGGAPLVDGTALPTAGGVDGFVDEGTLAPYSNGLNFCVQIRNRTDTSNSKTWAYLARTKGSRV